VNATQRKQLAAAMNRDDCEHLASVAYRVYEEEIGKPNSDLLDEQALLRAVDLCEAGDLTTAKAELRILIW